MKNLSMTSLLLSALLSASVLAGPSEEAKAKRTIERAQRQLQTVARQLESKPQPGPFEIKSWNSKLEKSRDFLQRARGVMQNEGGTNGENQQLLNAVEQQLATLTSRVNSSSSDVENAQSLASGGGAQSAIAEYEKLADAYFTVSQWVLSPEEGDPKLMNLYSDAMEAEKFLDQKYASVIGRRDRVSFPITAAAKKADNNKMAIKMRTQALLQQGPTMIDQMLNEASTAAQTLQKNGAFAGWETSVEAKIDQAQLLAKKMTLLAPDDPRSQTAAQKTAAKAGQMEAVKKTFRAKMIASNKMPADRYQGGDAAQLKAAVKQKWQNKFPQDQVLQVVIADSSWSDFSGTEWVSSARKWQSYDFDRMKALVKVAGNGQYNYKFAAFIVRQNLQGGRIDILTTRPKNPESDVNTLLAK